MRQIGTLPNKLQADRFTGFLITQGIDVFAEQEDADWVIWVRDEDQLLAAREALQEFCLRPEAARYAEAVPHADRLRKQQELHRQSVAKNLIDVRTQVWGSPRPGRIPLTLILMGISIAVTVISSFGKQPQPMLQQLAFRNPLAVAESADWRDGWRDIKSGQLWRLVTPIFIHYSPIHILFNMLMLFSLGPAIEIKRGTASLGVLVIVIAVISNCAQFLFSGSTGFGGMSGVLYGLFGFVWIRMLRHPEEGFRIAPQTIQIMLLWLVLCFTGLMGNIANYAHLFGLFAGAGLAAALPPLRPRTPR